METKVNSFNDGENTKISIPERIRHLLFCRVGRFSKDAFETDMLDNPYTHEQILPFLAKGENYGILSGYHNLVTLDCDCKEYVELAEKRLPPTFTVQSSSPNKRHFLFHMTDFVPHLNKIALVEKDFMNPKKPTGGDIRHKRFYTVGPGSIHPVTRRPYTVHDDVPIATLSFAVLNEVFGKFFKASIMPPGVNKNVDDSCEAPPIADVVEHYKIKLAPRHSGDEFFGPHPVHGSTNGSNFHVNVKDNVWCCFRCNTGGGALSLIAVMEGIIDCAEARPGSLTGDRFKKTLKIAEEKLGFKIENDHKNLPQGEVLTRICEEYIKTYFTNQQGEPFVVLPVDGHLETCSARSTRLRNWLAGLYREKNHRPPNSDALKQAQIQVEVMCSKAQQLELFNRIGWHEGAIYYDLTTPDWKGVKITKDGWEITALPPVFRRYKHQAAQVIPTTDGNPINLLRFCNIREDDHCLFMVTVATFFIHGVPHVMPYLDGTQGGGKSITSKSTKGLVDPSSVMLMSIPKDLAHAQMIGDKHWVITFDNISYIAAWFSDFLCRGVTGEGDMKRSLYTDDDEFIRSYRRCFILNGIGTYADRPDLLDRSIIFGIPELHTKRSEEEIEAEWKQMLPGILGGFFTAVSKAMGIVDQIKGHKAFRMSDYARWGAALAEPLGYSQDEFFKKYQGSIDRKWEDAADVNTLNGKVVELMHERDEWKGSFSELLEEVNPRSGQEGKGYREARITACG